MWRRLPGPGRRNASGCSRRPGGEALCPWRLHQARLSSSTGARTSRSSAAFVSSCRWRTAKLCYSRAFIIRAYLLQTHEMLFDAHNHAFRVLGGVPRRGHLRQHAHRRGQGRPRQGTQRQCSLFGHDQSLTFSKPSSVIRLPDGRRDRSRRTSRMRGIASGKACPAFESLDALNGWLEQRCRELWGQIPAWQRTGNDRRCLGPRSREPHAHGPSYSMGSWTIPSGSRRLAWSTWSATATACRLRSPTARSACASIPTGSWSWRKGRSSANTAASSTVPMKPQDGRFMTGAIIWR